MSESSQKTILAIIAIASFLWGMFQTYELQRAKKADFKVAHYSEVSSLASKVAVAIQNKRPADEYQEALTELTELNWGSLNLAASPGVQLRLGAFLKAAEDGGPFIRSYSYCLALEMRNDVAEAGGSFLSQLEDEEADCDDLL